MKKITIILLALLFISSTSFSQNMATIKVSQKSLSENLQIDEIGAKTFTISNQGETNLTFSIVGIETSGRIQETPSVSNTIGDEPRANIEYLKKRVENGTHGVSWLNLNISNKTLLPNESVEIEMSFDPNGLSDDIYTARLLISSNDPENGEEIIPITMVVGADRSTCQGFQTTDNENNAGTGASDNDIDVYLFRGDPGTPIEFNVFLDEPAPITTAQLSVLAWDVDETAGEIDPVYFNGNFVGNLTGNDNQWNTSVFYINPAWVVAGPGGKNTVQVQIDDLNEGWAVQIDWAQLIVNGCQTGNAFLRYVNLDDACYSPSSNVGVTVEVDSDLDPQSVRVEVNLLNENMISVDGASNTYNVSLTADEPWALNLTIPGGATLGSTYNVQVIVYDAATNLQQDILMVPFMVDDPCVPPVPVSDWAIYFAVLLIGIAVWFRFKTRIA